MINKIAKSMFLLLVFFYISIEVPNEFYNVFFWLGLNYRKNAYIDSELVYQLDDDFSLELGNKLPGGACSKKYRRADCSEFFGGSFYTVDCNYRGLKYTVGYRKFSKEIIWLETKDAGFNLQNVLYTGIRLNQETQQYFSKIERPKDRVAYSGFLFKFGQTVFDNWQCVLSTEGDSYQIFNFFKTSLKEFNDRIWETHPHVTKVYGVAVYIPWFLFPVALVSMLYLIVSFFVAEKRWIKRIRIPAWVLYALYLAGAGVYIVTNEILYGYL